MCTKNGESFKCSCSKDGFVLHSDKKQCSKFIIISTKSLSICLISTIISTKNCYFRESWVWLIHETKTKACILLSKFAEADEQCFLRGSLSNVQALPNEQTDFSYRQGDVDESIKFSKWRPGIHHLPRDASTHCLSNNLLGQSARLAHTAPRTPR